MTAEQRARDEAIVLAALPGPDKSIKNILWRSGFPDLAENKQRRMWALARLKRAGKVRFVGTVWEAVKCPDQ